MAYKCRICNSNEVDQPGGICELCAASQDPYAIGLGHSVPPAAADPGFAPDAADSYIPKRNARRQIMVNGGASLANRDPYGNDMTPSQPSSTVQVHPSGQTPQPVSKHGPDPVQHVSAGSQPLATGITKNITTDNQKHSFLSKWFRALFTSIPFTLDDDVTAFQVFPDYTGTSVNALGNACDQVFVYGRLNHGAVSENNDVEIYGRRDSSNNIIAKTIKNKATGTTITPQRSLGAGAVWAITAIVILLIAAAVSVFGLTGIIWSAVILLCLTSLPTSLKVAGVVFGVLLSIFKWLFSLIFK